MEQHHLLALPLIDAKVVVGLEVRRSFDDIPSRENPVFLMAGGFGSRLQPLTNSVPADA